MTNSMRCLLVFTLLILVGCGGSSEPPTSGDALKKHLLGIIDARHEAFLSGDARKARTFQLPESLAEHYALVEAAGKEVPDYLSDEEIATVQRIGKLFARDLPVELETAGNWARIKQTGMEEQTPMHVAYFLLRDGRWWLVSASRTSAGTGFAHLRAETYWPDNIADFFLLPEITLQAEPTATQPDGPLNQWRLAVTVTNQSDQTISATAMKRWFTEVQHLMRSGEKVWASAAKLGGEVDLAALKPGETRRIGEIDVRRPQTPSDQLILRAAAYNGQPLHFPP